MASRRNNLDQIFIFIAVRIQMKIWCFLSFGGDDDAIKDLADHPYTALVHAWIHAFKDKDELPEEEEEEDISSKITKSVI
jgi:hypothetical protein